MNKKNPIIAALYCDGYKIGHIDQDCPGTEVKYYTWTPRSNKYLPEVNKVLVWNIQGFIKKHLIEFWNNNFFNLKKEDVIGEYKRVIKSYLFKEDVDTKHIEELHDLGYLPLKIRAIKEGELVPFRVPVLTIENTDKRFAWLSGYIEDILSTSLWQPMTVASIAYQYKKLFEKYAIETVGNADFCKFQGHDFSYRGLMPGTDAIEESGGGHLSCFVGTDNIPAIPYLEEYYNADCTKELIGCSVPASEHSVAETYMEFDDNGNLVPGWEDEYLRHLIQDVYPKGIVSIVSDTIDLWKLITEKLVNLKDIIMTRDGKVVIRPDSGNPADILCGKNTYLNGFKKGCYLTGYSNDTPEAKGVIELLWDIFGGTMTEKGYKLLDSHIGAIYGDSITLELAEEINERLKAKGFASINWVAGIGSYSYLGKLSRDSGGWALKETAITKNGKEIAVFKDPITDDGTKKSAKGRVVVIKDSVTDEIHYIDGLNSKEQEEFSDVDMLEVIFKDGVLLRDESLADIRGRIK